VIHESVVQRMAEIREYRPVNFPLKFETLPMPTAPVREGGETA
jgi:hypothetical protein